MRRRQSVTHLFHKHLEHDYANAPAPVQRQVINDCSIMTYGYIMSRPETLFLNFKYMRMIYLPIPYFIL